MSSHELSYLNDIINNLKSTQETRNQLKKNVESDFKKSDQKLGDLVTENFSSLESLVNSFQAISGRIADSQNRVRSVKDTLQSCKNLLRCKRDELRQLWTNAIEQKTLSAMLNQVDKVQEFSQQLPFLLKERQFLEASKSVIKYRHVIETELGDVDSLREAKTELETKRKDITKKIEKELEKQIYTKTRASIFKNFQRLDSVRVSIKSNNSTGNQSNVDLKEDLVMDNERIDTFKRTDLKSILKATDITDIPSEEIDIKPVQYLGVLVESLAILGDLDDVLMNLNRNLKRNLNEIISHSSRLIIDNSGESFNDPSLLKDLFDLIFQQICLVARIHEILLVHVERVKNKINVLDSNTYKVIDVWIQAEKVIRTLFLDYVDFNDEKSSKKERNTIINGNADLSIYFSRKRPKNTAQLYRFDHSSHAITLKTYEREERQTIYADVGVQDTPEIAPQISNVCSPSPHNIVYIYSLVVGFANDIGCALKNSNTLLLGDVENFMQQNYLGKIKSSCFEKLSFAMSDDDWHKDTVLINFSDSNSQLPVFKASMCIIDSINKIKDLEKNIPNYLTQFTGVLDDILFYYFEKTEKLFQTLTSRHSISSLWVKDEDISRLFKSQPSWLLLQTDSGTVMNVSVDEFLPHAEKEASYFTNNLTAQQTLLTEKDLLNGNSSDTLKSFCYLINTTLFVLKYIEEFHMVVKNHIKELRDKCLLILYIEIRVNCFFCLQPIAGNIEKTDQKIQIAIREIHEKTYNSSIDDLKVDSHVTDLTRSLTSLSDALSCLHPSYYRYVISGLGHVIGSILISCSAKLKRMSINGIKKMIRNVFCLQQIVTKISGTRTWNSGFDNAREYYEILYRKPDEVINACVEHSNRFTTLQLEMLLKLHHKSQRAPTEELEEKLKKLHMSLAENTSIV